METQRQTWLDQSVSNDELSEGIRCSSIEDENWKTTSENEEYDEFFAATKSDSDDVFLHRSKFSNVPKKNRKTLRRTRSAYAPSPDNNFGPKGTLQQLQNEDQLIVLQDPSSQRLLWTSPPNHLLVIRKYGPTTIREFRILSMKIYKRGFHLYVEETDYEYLLRRKDNELKKENPRFHCFDRNKDSCTIDLVVCLGGDGTLIHTANIFQRSCPPVLSFSLGSLGFLTPFPFEIHEKILDEVLSGNVAVLLRTRLHCEVISDDNNSSPAEDSKINGNNTNLALNEIVIDRGAHPYLSNLDIFINDKYITKVQGDGLIISTPTGSTAYAMAAGASMVHPNVQAIILSPICPHSLSFRPTIVPAGIELKIKVSEDARVCARVCIDGRAPTEINQKNSVKITTSIFPVPVICQRDPVADWFDSLAGILHWNLRKFQTSLVKSSPNDDDDENLDLSEGEKTSEDNQSSSEKSTSQTTLTDP